MPTRMNVHSKRRAVTYPSAGSSLCRLTTGKITTAVPMFAMMSSNSRSAPKKIRVSSPPLAMYPTGSSSTGWKSNTAGIDVTKVMRYDEGDEVEDAEDTRPLLVREH